MKFHWVYSTPTDGPGLLQPGLLLEVFCPGARVGQDVGAAVSLGVVASTIMMYLSKFDIYIYKYNFN